MNNQSEKLDEDRLVHLLQDQQALYRQLRLLTDRQKSLVEEGDTGTLLTLLTERQRHVDELMGLNARLAPYRENWTVFYAGLNEIRRKQVAGLLEDVNGSLNAILQSDGKDTAILTAKRESMAGQLAAFDAGSRASAAYAKAAGAARSSLTDAEA
ncbi:MAG: hypothetical protein MI923_17730 [Phycisphaerales bacterium]|nr:hypothetical protein [Phycisphaerales bacterium]